MSVAPPEWVCVLLGHGSFLRDDNGDIRFDANRKPLFVFPPTDTFLNMKPSKQSQQFWPYDPVKSSGRNKSIVLLSIHVNTDCRYPGLITEIGISIFDMATIYHGVRGCRKRRVAGCEAPGARGENINKLCLSQHYIVKDTAYHHPGTCDSPAHEAQPYHFCFRKSKELPREMITKTLNDAFHTASIQGVHQEDIKRGVRRHVVLVGWGDENYDRKIQNTAWFKENWTLQRWDIRQHPMICKHIGNPTYLSCLNVFGIQHRAHGKSVAFNAGNRSAFTIQLLLAVCFLTQEQQRKVRAGESLEPSIKFPGVESALARDNRPPGSAPLTNERVPILH